MEKVEILRKNSHTDLLTILIGVERVIIDTMMQ